MRIRDDPRPQPLHPPVSPRPIKNNPTPGPGHTRTVTSSAALAGITATAVGALAAWTIASGEIDATSARLENAVAARAQIEAGVRMRERASRTADAVERFIAEHEVRARAWAQSPTVIEAARERGEAHRAQGLDTTDTETIEDRYRRGLLTTGAEAAQRWLKRRSETDGSIGEIFFTDSAGLNAAATNRTSDFVQSDERWWQHAAAHGTAIGEIDYDESAQVWSIDISVAITDDTSDALLGVMKVVVDVAEIQALAERARDGLAGARVVIADTNGALIADTASGHAPQRLGRDNAKAWRTDTPTLADAMAHGHHGTHNEGGWLGGYAPTGGRTIPGWTVLIERPVATIAAETSAGGADAETMKHWPAWLAGLLLAIGALATSASTIAARTRADRFTEAVEAVSTSAQRATRGVWDTETPATGPAEAVRLADTVRGMATVLRTVSRELVKHKRNLGRETS